MNTGNIGFVFITYFKSVSANVSSVMLNTGLRLRLMSLSFLMLEIEIDILILAFKLSPFTIFDDIKPQS